MVISAIKEAEGRSGSYIIRLFNVADREEEGRLNFDHEVLSARVVTLDEQPITELPVNKNEVSIQVQAKKIVTIEVKFV